MPIHFSKSTTFGRLEINRESSFLQTKWTSILWQTLRPKKHWFTMAPVAQVSRSFIFAQYTPFTSVSQSVGRSIGRSVGRSFVRSIARSVSRSVSYNYAVIELVSQWDNEQVIVSVNTVFLFLTRFRFYSLVGSIHLRTSAWILVYPNICTNISNSCPFLAEFLALKRCNSRPRGLGGYHGINYSNPYGVISLICAKGERCILNIDIHWTYTAFIGDRS